MHGVYAMSAITALTAQNTTGVRAVLESTPNFLKEQIDAIFEDIYPDAVKIGMVSSSELIQVIAERLRYYKAKNIVVDPVMVATSGSSLIKTDAIETLIKELLPISTLVTPNIPEAEVLSGMSIQTKEDMLMAVNRSYNKSDYIPCITWGRNARYVGEMSVGTKLEIVGRIQSRDYVKKLEGVDEPLKKTAYEISVSKVTVCE